MLCEVLHLCRTFSDGQLPLWDRIHVSLLSCHGQSLVDPHVSARDITSAGRVGYLKAADMQAYR